MQHVVCCFVIKLLYSLCCVYNHDMLLQLYGADNIGLTIACIAYRNISFNA